jgi:hypothetical protein
VDKRRKLLAHVGTIAAPVLVLVGARVLLAPPPAAASGGAITPVASATTAPTKVTLSPAQQRAMEWSQNLASEGLKSPLCRVQDRPVQHVEHTQPDPEPIQTPEPEAIPHVDPTLGLRLTAIMGTVDSGMAMVNGKVYRVDQEVRPGLRILAIDARMNRIVLVDSEGAQYVLGRTEE